MGSSRLAGSSGSGDRPRNVIHRCCAGLDLHKKTIVANIRRIEADGQPSLQTRTFSTMTVAALEMTDWFAAEGVTHVAMEATGV
ncbi:MAG TPA: hypothetical protein VKP69_27010, partial [Isosphaeraceae bacterium]|nr:hypothetical protein [Isosphaeraceae bacterium]